MDVIRLPLPPAAAQTAAYIRIARSARVSRKALESGGTLGLAARVLTTMRYDTARWAPHAKNGVRFTSAKRVFFW